MGVHNIGMLESLETLLAQEERLSQIANNLANVDTVGYKKDSVAFQEALIRARNGHQRVGKLNITTTDQGQAATDSTGNPFDLAITGDGFFKIQTPRGIRYSRAGNFIRNSHGQLVTPDGDPVLGKGGQIVINNGGRVTIGPDGYVNVDGQRVNQLAVVTFANPGALTKEGKNYFRITDDAGQEKTSAAFTIQQGFLEKSNVNTITEMTSMTELLRIFESEQRVVRTIDDMDSLATARVGKLTP